MSNKCLLKLAAPSPNMSPVIAVVTAEHPFTGGI